MASSPLIAVAVDAEAAGFDSWDHGDVEILREPHTVQERQTTMTSGKRFASIVLAAMILGACGGDDPASETGSETPTSTTTSDIVPQEPQVGDAAVWRLDPDEAADASSNSFTALVTRLDCNGGVTGPVFDPIIEIETEEIIVTFSVEPVAGGDCPSNDEVAVTVELGEAIGTRAVFDGACLDGEATTTSFCSEDGGRRIN